MVASRMISARRKLCGVFCAVPAIGAARSTWSGNLTAHSYVCWAPIDPPTTSASRSTPKYWRSSRSCATTSSPIRIRGNFDMASPALAPSALCGETDRPLPIWLTATIKYRSGFSACSGPT